MVAVTAELDQWIARSPLQRADAAKFQTYVPMPVHVLVVEDRVADLNACISVLQKMGVGQLDAISNVRAALLRLEEINEGKLARPDLIILDLNFSTDSGFEVLRYWKSNPPLRSIPVIIWTGLGGSEQELCRAFGVHRVVPKWAGTRELQEAIRSVKPREPAGSPVRAAASPRR